MSLGLMNQTTYQRVQQARNQQEALFAIAAALDEIKASLATRLDDNGWPTRTSEWAETGPSPVDRVAQRVWPTEDGDDAIKALRAVLGNEHDPETRMALEAQLRLLTDKGRPGYVAPPVMVLRHELDTTTDVVIPPVSVDRQIARIAWANKVGLHDYLTPVEDAWTPEDAAAAFAKGGPMWLYLGNRLAVMQLPVADRGWLVNELDQDSPTEAHEMGRDILKADESSDPTITTTAIDAMSGKQ